MSDFVRKPLLSLLNKKNVLKRLEKLERNRAKPTATVERIDEVANTAGSILGEFINEFSLPNPEYLQPMHSDYIKGIAVEDFIFTAIGAGTNARATDVSGHNGIMAVTQSGANTGGYYSPNTAFTNNLIPSSFVMEAFFKFSTSNQNIVIQFGYIDSNSTTDPTNGVYVEGVPNASGGGQ